ncbi:hypothetical protein [Opitutus terrae]|uniref:Uncharacterized protein n=1 Tax=Opitutus terrae (strain DSM 11246 / JCM 15787 / PB90-1) TaxID=452637 RepID=B1ZW77_OPITP|nr:hypothetical protein [Opitutus terrae]ACB76829.1 hypothetical protein Oter_3552 [Opitutus terrae PB90-1]
MTLHWVPLVPALLLLLFPADRLLSARVELRSFDCFNSLDNSPRHRPWWWVPALWVDPFRGFAGTWLLIAALGLDVGFWSLLPKDGYGVLLAILGLSIFSQTITRRGGRGVLLAPIGFVAGLVAALTPWSLALPALAGAVLGLFGFRRFGAFFTCGALALPLLGMAFGTEPFWMVPAASALALPALAAAVSGSTLELPTRNDSGPRLAR